MKMEPVPEEMEIQDMSVVAQPLEPLPDQSWSSQLFPGAEPDDDIYPRYYMGDEEGERFEAVDELFRCN